MTVKEHIKSLFTDWIIMCLKDISMREQSRFLKHFLFTMIPINNSCNFVWLLKFCFFSSFMFCNPDSFLTLAMTRLAISFMLVSLFGNLKHQCRRWSLAKQLGLDVFTWLPQQIMFSCRIRLESEPENFVTGLFLFLFGHHRTHTLSLSLKCLEFTSYEHHNVNSK